MKRTFIATFIMISTIAAFTQAEEQKPLSQKEISQGMAETWCQKMDECSKDKTMSTQECQRVLFKSFKTKFDKLPKELAFALERPTFQKCQQNILKGTCDSLQRATTLDGCEFIGLLNR